MKGRRKTEEEVVEEGIGMNGGRRTVNEEKRKLRREKGGDRILLEGN